MQVFYLFPSEILFIFRKTAHKRKNGGAYSFIMIKNKFLLCGLTGWCLEVFWTGLKSLQRRQMKLEGHSSIWMFPIYGAASLLSPLSRALRGKCVWIRGTVYACSIFAVEFMTGSFLKKYNLCPWDYSRSRWNVRGVIRLDYAPVWFLTGLLYERLLQGRQT